MALAHAPGVYVHGMANFSTPSFSSTSHSSRQDVNTLKHMFSSPLAERYARDGSSAQTSNLGSGYCNKGDGSCRIHHRHDSTWFEPKPRIKNAMRPDPLDIASDNKEQQSNCMRREPTVLTACHATLRRDSSRPLLSPISFTPPTNTTEASDTIGSHVDNEHLDSPYQKAVPSATVASIIANDGNRCAFPDCEFDVGAANGDVSSNKADVKRLDGITTIKPRALSLGEGLRLRSPGVFPSHGSLEEVQPGRAIHRTTGSRELRRSAGSVNMNRDCGPWVDQIIQATRYAGSFQNSGNHGLPRYGRPRLWLDATKHDERVEEAVSQPVFRPCTRELLMEVQSSMLQLSPIVPQNPR